MNVEIGINSISSPTEREQREEFAHTLTHAFGLIASVVGVGVLIFAAATRGDMWHVIGCTVFGLSLVLVYASSTLYHGTKDPVRKVMFQRLDHIAIYLLIAGTYTPFTLAKIPWPVGSTLLAVVWTLAAIGIGFEFIQKSKKRYASVVLYFVMGWMIVLQIGPLLRSIESGGVAMLLLGGVTYTAGLVFYFWDRLPYNHAIWHGFVLGGSALHFGSVMIFVVPA